ncbi:T-cell-interacting, activating receptor on myeloid cells protein 1-like [Anomaloglossus baeobatrachus]|uniref:T-cell-interacting, activating receptor on myeloid cells protein 1-like n=1 Tax=Anomaloglossus baeobatrachus TaxID=238106 RepID=UPI003F4FE3D3
MEYMSIEDEVANQDETNFTPSISVQPNSSIPAGSNIIIQCNAAMPGETFILYQNGRELFRKQSIGFKAEFLIVNVSLKHQGNYFCMMHSNSRMSSHVRITVQSTEETILTPSISVQPNSSIPAGSNVTIQCNAAMPGETFILYQNGRKLFQKQSIGFKAEFLIVNVSLKHQGNYFCMMHSNSRMSNHVRITVQSTVHESIFLSIIQRGSLFLGSNVTLRCNGTEKGETVDLYKDEEIYEQRESDGSIVDFTYIQINMEHEGIYFCKTSFGPKISNKIDLWIDVSSQQSSDYTMGNIIRLTIAGVLLLVIGGFSEYCCRRKNPKMEKNRLTTSNEYEYHF